MTPDQRGNDLAIATDDDAGVSARGITRRQALTLAGGTAAAFGATVGPFTHLFVSGAAEGDQPAEIILSTWLVGIELAARDLYETVGQIDGLNDALAALASTCGAHHNAQSKALASMVTAAGATAPSEADAAFKAQFEPRLGKNADPAGVAGALADLENGFAATYQAALATLASAPIAAIAAQILATDAAHAVAWTAAASPDSRPGTDAIPASQGTDGAFAENTSTPTTTGGSAAPAPSSGPTTSTPAKTTTTSGDHS